MNKIHHTSYGEKEKHLNSEACVAMSEVTLNHSRVQCFIISSSHDSWQSSKGKRAKGVLQMTREHLFYLH